MVWFVCVDNEQTDSGGQFTGEASYQRHRKRRVRLSSWECSSAGTDWRYAIRHCTGLRSVHYHWHLLTLWRPLLPYGYSYKASCARSG